MNQRKIAMFIATAVSCTALCVACTSCNEESAKKQLTGEYLSSARVETSMVFTSTYVETLQLYSDNTYCLEFTGSTFYRGAEGGSDSAWGNYKISYYGTCTTTSEEGVMSVTISIPERVTLVSGITVSSSLVTQWDSLTDSSVKIGDNTTVTSEAMLKEFNIDGRTISVNEATYQFTYIDLGLELLALSQHFGSLGVGA